MLAALLKPFLKQMFIFQTETSSHKYSKIFSSFQIVSFDIPLHQHKITSFSLQSQFYFGEFIGNYSGVLYIILSVQYLNKNLIIINIWFYLFYLGSSNNFVLFYIFRKYLARIKCLLFTVMLFFVKYCPLFDRVSCCRRLNFFKTFLLKSSRQAGPREERNI